MGRARKPWVILDAPYVCARCGQGLEPGAHVRPGPGGLEHVGRCPSPESPPEVVELTEDEGPLGEESIEAQAARAGFSDHAIVSARDGTVRLFQALVYRRGDRIGVVFTAWPIGLANAEVSDVFGVRLGVERWETTESGGVAAAQARFSGLVLELGRVAHDIESRYCVGRRQR